jgi:hypothetical protein
MTWFWPSKERRPPDNSLEGLTSPSKENRVNQTSGLTKLSSKERWSCRQGCLEAKMTRFWRHQALGYYISWLLGLSALLQVPGWSAYQAVGRADRDAFKLKLLDFEDTKLYAGVLYFLKSHLSSVKIKSFYHQCIPVCKTTCTHWAF